MQRIISTEENPPLIEFYIRTEELYSTKNIHYCLVNGLTKAVQKTTLNAQSLVTASLDDVNKDTAISISLANPCFGCEARTSRHPTAARENMDLRGSPPQAPRTTISLSKSDARHRNRSLRRAWQPPLSFAFSSSFSFLSLFFALFLSQKLRCCSTRSFSNLERRFRSSALLGIVRRGRKSCDLAVIRGT